MGTIDVQEVNAEATNSKAYVPIGNLVENQSQAISFAKELADASLKHFDTSSSQEPSSNNEFKKKVIWKEIAKVQHNGCEISIEASPATGERGPFGPSLMRAFIPVSGGKSAEEIYAFLISKEGYEFLDPDADPNDFQRAVLGPYSFANDYGEGKIQVEKASLRLPCPLANRDYVVLNAFFNQSRTFISTSCCTPAVCKNASPYDDGPTTKTSFFENVQMGIYGAYSVDDVKDESIGSTCVLKVAQYVDMNGFVPATFSNKGNLVWFQNFTKRALDRFPLVTNKL